MPFRLVPNSSATFLELNHFQKHLCESFLSDSVSTADQSNRKTKVASAHCEKSKQFGNHNNFCNYNICAIAIKFAITTVCVITMKHAITSNFANTHSTQGSSRTQSIGRSSLMLVPNFQLICDQHVSSIQPIASETCIYQQLCWARSCRLWL